MLKEISCDAFKIGDQPRPPVRFHMGLNTILGSVTGAAGSIGKSTMMLIIDFVFGGNTYTQSDAVNELDPTPSTSHSNLITLNTASPGTLKKRTPSL